MLLNLTSIIGHPGSKIPFEVSYDLSELDFSGQQPVSEPLRAVGRVENVAGVLILRAELSTRMHCLCDRCARPFEKDKVQQLEAVLSEDAEDDDSDSVYPLKEDCVDLDEVIQTAFILEMDTKFLCGPDCKGLCHRCGANLNEGPCSCEKETDPRLEALRQLLK